MVAGAEESGASAGTDLEEEKGDNTTMTDNTQQSNIIRWR
jgi:hypothetical protein